MPPPITGTGHNFVFADELFYTTVQTGANETTVVNSFVDGLVPHNPTPPHNQYYDGVFIDPSLQALHDELKMKNKAALTKKKVIDENTTVAVYFGLPYVGNSTDKFICGIEYEVEAVSYYEVNKSTELFPVHATEDGSLKYCGYEFITNPLTYEEHIDVYQKLMGEVIKFMSEKERFWEPFNERTSTHVHVNLTYLTSQQVENLVLLYTLLEPLFFANVDEHRKHNIHCVPINDTLLIKNLALKPKHVDLLSRLKAPEFWHKYSAFNLLPLRKLGTVEFRHLQGARDLDTVRNWLRLLAAFYEICVNKETNIPALVKSFVNNTKMDYLSKVSWYFPTLYPFTPKLLERDFKLDMEKSENNIAYILFEQG